MRVLVRRVAVFLVVVLRAAVLRVFVLRAAVLRAGFLRLDDVRLDVLRFRDCPDSDMAIAIACLRLLTFLPEPLFKVPCLCSCMTFSTFFFWRVVAMSGLRLSHITKR